MSWVFPKGLLAVFPPLCPAHVLSVSSAFEKMMAQKPRFDLSDSVWWQASEPTRTLPFPPRSFSQVVGGNSSRSCCPSPIAQLDTRQKPRAWRPDAKRFCAWFTMILTLSVRTHAGFLPIGKIINYATNPVFLLRDSVSPCFVSQTCYTASDSGFR